MTTELTAREAPASYLVERALVPPGYKQTEVGVIPEDWEVVQFGAVATPRKQRVDPKKGEAHEFCVELEHIGSGTGTLLGYASTNEQSSLKSIFRTDDVLFGKLRAYLRKYWLANREGVCSTEIWVLSPTGRLASSAYLFQLVQTDNFVEAASSSYGTHMPRSDWSVVRNYALPLPPTKAEQEAIAEALSDADALIASLERLIAKKRQLKQGAMQELLTGKKRLPGFTGEWEEKLLGEVLTIRHGKSQHGVADKNGPYPILATGGQIGTANRFIYDKPSVLIGRKGTIDQPQFMDTPFWSVDTLFYSEIHEPNSAKFLYYRFCLIDWRQYNEASGVPSLNARTIEQIETLAPKSEEQTAIAAILSDMDTEIAALAARLAKARVVKQGMMQELLTGRIRLV